MANMMHNAHRAGTAMPDWLFVIWAGGTALVSYSLVYALRKPFTAAEFEDMQAFGMDYKIAVSIIQLIGYVCAKMLGIKFISELRPENRLRFIIGSAALSEASLLAFALMPVPANIFALFFNGLSLGCMWGVLFSFLEGRRTTDILASIMGGGAWRSVRAWQSRPGSTPCSRSTWARCGCLRSSGPWPSRCYASPGG